MAQISPRGWGAGLSEGRSTYQHAQLHGQHGHPGLRLRLLLGLTQRSGPLGVAHVPQAHPGHVQPLRLHAHARHVLPDSLAAAEDTGLGERPPPVPGNAGTWPDTRSLRRGPRVSPTASPTEQPGKLGPTGPLKEDVMTVLSPSPQLGPCPLPRHPLCCRPTKTGGVLHRLPAPPCPSEHTHPPTSTSIPGCTPSGPESSHRDPGSAGEWV